MSTKALLLSATEPPIEDVPVPELNTTFRLRGMTGTQRDAFEASLIALSANGRKRSLDTANIRAKLLVHSIIDAATGEPMFTPAEAVELGKVRADVLDRLFTVAQRLSGVSDRDVEELGKK